MRREASISLLRAASLSPIDCRGAADIVWLRHPYASPIQTIGHISPLPRCRTGISVPRCNRGPQRMLHLLLPSQKAAIELFEKETVPMGGQLFFALGLVSFVACAGEEKAASGTAHHDRHSSVDSTNQVCTFACVGWPCSARLVALCIQDSVRSVDVEPVDGSCDNHVCETKYGFYRYGPFCRSGSIMCDR